MIIAVDIETQGLDATRFLFGCIVKERNIEKSEVYYTKKEMWNRIKELGEAEKKRGKTLTVYAHNHTYDFYGYAKLNDKNITTFSTDPFICGYKEEEGREYIKFLDTLAIYRTSLREVGKMIGHEKKETPEELMQEDIKLTPAQIKEMIPYCENDTIIVIKAIQKVKETLEKDNVKIKRLYTINQIAVQYILHKLTELEKEKIEHLFWNIKTSQARRTFRAEEIHSAYRGGRVECFTTGTVDRATSLDRTNAYGKELIDMECPDLRTERKQWKPLQHGLTVEEAIKGIGICRAILINKSNQIGLIPVRTDTGNYYPKEGKIIIGTYTNKELRLAIKEGYEIINIEWRVTWGEAHNPFKDIIPEIYKKRQSGGAFEKYFYKSIINRSLGKLAQTRTGQEIIIDSVEKAEEYTKRNYEIIKGIRLNYMYKKDTKEKRKKYYMPIIPTIINANCRITMYNEYKKIPKEDLLYTDTDSIIFKGNHLEKFKDVIGEEIGQFKIEAKDERAIIWSRKTYSIGNMIKLAGITKKDITPSMFEDGYVKSRQMITLKTTKDLKDVGKFKESKEDLHNRKTKHQKIIELYEEQDIFVDKDIEDINYFLGDIKNLTEPKKTQKT